MSKENRIRMKILIVCSGNSPNFVFEKNMAFVYDQINAIKRLDKAVSFNLFLVQGRGFKGYLSQRTKLIEMIDEYQPDIVHAHGGHIGMLTLLQLKVPVVVTFHGSEVNHRYLRWISEIVLFFSTHSIFVSNKMLKKMHPLRKNYSIIPCGVDLAIFTPMDSIQAKIALEIPVDERYILFASSFSNIIKNFHLAQTVLDDFPDYTIREIKDKTRSEVNLLINGSEAVLMTSFSEGSPQIIKEALACNQRIISVNVGDVVEQLSGVDACVVCQPNKDEIVIELKKILTLARPTFGRRKAEIYDAEKIALQVYDIYTKTRK